MEAVFAAKIDELVDRSHGQIRADVAWPVRSPKGRTSRTGAQSLALLSIDVDAYTT
jgi:hypothetical protein